MNNRMGKRLAARLCGLSTIIIMVFVLVFFTIINGANGVNFLTPSNVSTIINQASFLVIVGIGQAIVILLGGVNLSMGAVMAFTTVLCNQRSGSCGAGAGLRRFYRLFERSNGHKAEYTAIHCHLCYDVCLQRTGVGISEKQGFILLKGKLSCDRNRKGTSDRGLYDHSPHADRSALTICILSDIEAYQFRTQDLFYRGKRNGSQIFRDQYGSVDDPCLQLKFYDGSVCGFDVCSQVKLCRTRTGW